MKGKRLGLILLGLSLALTSVLPNVKQVAANPTSQVSSADKPLRKIAFISFEDKDVWVVNEDGSGLTKIGAILPAGGYVEEVRWSPDGRWLGYSGWVDIFRQKYSEAIDESGKKTHIETGSLAGWLPDSSGFVVNFNKLIDNGIFTYSNYITIQAKDYLSVFPRERVLRWDTFDGLIHYSPKHRYIITQEAVSKPVDTTGMPDSYIYELTIKEKQTGETVAVLSQRNWEETFWSEKEDKVAFYEDNPPTLVPVLMVYELPDNLLARIDNVWDGAPVLFLPDGKRLIYYIFYPKADIGYTIRLFDLDTGEGRILEGVNIISQLESPRRDDLRLAEAGTKLVYNRWGFWTGDGGLFSYDLENGEIKKLVDVGWEEIFAWDLAGDKIAYVVGGKLYLTDLNGSPPKLLATGVVSSPDAEWTISFQPQVPPEKFKNRKVLVLAQGIGSEVKEGYPRNVFPEYWPIINEAFARGIYQDVIVFSYAGGRIEEGKWIPATGHPEASFQSIKNSALVFSRTLSEYANVYPGVTYDVVGHSLGGKIAWEYLKMYLLLGEKARPFNIGKLITLGSPINGRHRDIFFDKIIPAMARFITGKEIKEAMRLISGEAVDELHSEAVDNLGQIETEQKNNQLYTQALREGTTLYSLATTDDCIVPQIGIQPYNSSSTTRFGVVYRGIGRGFGDVSIKDCILFEDEALDLDYLLSIMALPGLGDVDKIIMASGHDRYFWHPRIWLDLKDLIIFGTTPKRRQ